MPTEPALPGSYRYMLTNFNIVTNKSITYYHNPSGVYFELGGYVYQNNSILPIQEVGENENALYCRTNKKDCCSTEPNRSGDFYYPNRVRVPIAKFQHGFYRNRGERIVRLNRREGITSPTGQYRCEIPNANNVMVKIYITLTI